MNRKLSIAALILRVLLGVNFISAVIPRLGWTGRPQAWSAFLKYTAEVNAFAPAWIIPYLAVTATTLEISFALLLIVGFKTRLAAIGSSVLLLLFALAMCYSLGIRSAFDYSVFVDSAAALLLATLPGHEFSVDHFQKRLYHSKQSI